MRSASPFRDGSRDHFEELPFKLLTQTSEPC